MSRCTSPWRWSLPIVSASPTARRSRASSSSGFSIRLASDLPPGSSSTSIMFSLCGTSSIGITAQAGSRSAAKAYSFSSLSRLRIVGCRGTSASRERAPSARWARYRINVSSARSGSSVHFVRSIIIDRAPFLPDRGMNGVSNVRNRYVAWWILEKTRSSAALRSDRPLGWEGVLNVVHALLQ